MTVKYYLDTCVWRDFFENRIGFGGKPLGEYAQKLFLYIIRHKHNIVFSDALLWELKKEYSPEEIMERLQVLTQLGVLHKIPILQSEHDKAKEMASIRNIPFVDCLLAIQAKNLSAIMVTQDNHFFNNLSDVVEAKRPEDII